MADAMKLVPSRTDGLRVGQAILEAHCQWEKENRDYGDQPIWGDTHVTLLGQAAMLAASPPAREEAPAEGAGEFEARFPQLNDDLIRMASTSNTGSLTEWGRFIERLQSALRNNTSEPEAGAVACSRCGETNLMLCDCSLPGHPAPATADKLRVAVEALERAQSCLSTRIPGGVLNGDDTMSVIRLALAALNEQPQ